MDDIYKNLPLNDIPWNMETPPDALIGLIDNKTVTPCTTIDLGCGTGNYASYIAGCGFEVTGIDLSGEAIKLARTGAAKKGVQVRFEKADMLGDMADINDTFDFAYDWEVLHHIFPEQRRTYVENVCRLLNPKGKYLSVCFSIKDKQFGGHGKYRKTRLGTSLYFSTENEIETLFAPYFNIKELKTISVAGKMGEHWAVYCFMEKK
ncbi:class I SAM-dependent methyltransferase [Carboxylicivirga sp. RSCT41]|uniref:class I SAM-dependent methyltransferase n=1 Tax=Carboxylicivirga agarovorans TaxID=3417570 RepID=UPI003D32E137